MADAFSIEKERMKRKVLKFVLLIGVVSFFADFTYEGVRTVTGRYLAILGASATLIGFIAGYGLRLVPCAAVREISSLRLLKRNLPLSPDGKKPGVSNVLSEELSRPKGHARPIRNRAEMNRPTLSCVG